jgi:hypothetical protein
LLQAPTPYTQLMLSDSIVTSTGSGGCRLAAATALALSVPMLLLSQGLLLLLAAHPSVQLEVTSVPLSDDRHHAMQ